jgi:hypothetical protein
MPLFPSEGEKKPEAAKKGAKAPDLPPGGIAGQKGPSPGNATPISN